LVVIGTVIVVLLAFLVLGGGSISSVGPSERHVTTGAHLASDRAR